MANILLKIIVNEQQHENKEATCKKIISYLRDHGVPGATMRRGEAGLDYHGNISLDLLEDTYFNDLPVMIEAVLEENMMEKLEGGLAQMTAHGQISKVNGMKDNEMDKHSHFVVKIYTRESSKHIKKDEYVKILQLLQKHKAIWGTVSKAIAGYGSDGIIYGQHLFTVSQHLPLIIECIVKKEHLSNLLAELEQVVTEGAVFAAPAELIINK
ncbi:MAG: DUF190 domain-containing protein [Bacillota bacterium]